MSTLRAMAVFFLATGSASAAFTIPWSTLDSGGGTSAGGAFTINGTIGQFDAHAAGASGGVFSLNGGYWAQVAAMPGDPTLVLILLPNGDVSVQWQSTAIGWQLQTSLNLVTWFDLGGVIAGPGALSVMRDPNVTRRFFRLRLP